MATKKKRIIASIEVDEAGRDAVKRIAKTMRWGTQRFVYSALFKWFSEAPEEVRMAVTGNYLSTITDKAKVMEAITAHFADLLDMPIAGEESKKVNTSQSSKPKGEVKS